MSAPVAKAKPNSFQDLILRLQNYWAEQGCAILQPYDMEVGAGTLHPATVLRALGPKDWRAAYVQPSRRPADARYGENPMRLGHYYQYQVILKPNPKNLQDLYLNSLYEIGIDPTVHDSALLKRIGKTKPLALGGLVGKSGVTGWKSASTPISSRSVDSTCSQSRAS